MCAAFPRSDYYGGSAPRSRHRRTCRLAGHRGSGARIEVPMFKGETLGAVGGRLYPWQHGPHAKSGRGGGVPMSGTPSHADVATERWLRFSHCEFMLHTEDSITVFNSRVAPACFTLAPSVTRLGAEAPLRAFQTARLLQATGSVPVTFAVPFCTRPDPGEDDSIWSSVPPLLHGALRRAWAGEWRRLERICWTMFCRRRQCGSSS